MSMLNKKKALVAANLGMWLFQGLYTISPIDLVPDVIPLIGWFDDFLGLAVTVAFTVYTISVVRKYGIQGLLPAAKPVVATAGPERQLQGEAEYEPMSLDEIRAL